MEETLHYVRLVAALVGLALIGLVGLHGLISKLRRER